MTSRAHEGGGGLSLTRGRFGLYLQLSKVTDQLDPLDQGYEVVEDLVYIYLSGLDFQTYFMNLQIIKK